MNGQPGNDDRRLLAFLDLLSCAFGGVVLLFLVMLASAESTNRDSRSPAAVAGVPTDPAFVLLATIAEDEHARLRLHVTPDGGWSAEDRVAGRGHAFLTAPVVPPDGVRIELLHAGEGAARSEPAECEVTIVSGSHRFERRVGCLPGRPVVVWPVTED